VARLSPEIGFIYATELLSQAVGREGKPTKDELKAYAFALEAIYVTHQKALARAVREYLEKRGDELYGRLLAEKKRAGKKWKGVKLGSKTYSIHVFDPMHVDHMPRVSRRYVEALARQRAYDEVRGYLQDELIDQLDQAQPGIAQQLNAYSESQLLEMVGITDPLMKALLADGEKAQAEALSPEKLRESLVEATEAFGRIQETIQSSKALGEAQRKAQRQRKEFAEERALLGALLDQDRPGPVRFRSTKVPFTHGMCSAYSKGNVPREDGEPVRALIYLTMDRELFDDFVVFYEHDVPRAYGFDPRAATARAMAAGKPLTREQYQVLDRYRLQDKPIPRVEDVKRADGSFQRGVATKLADRIEALAAQSDVQRSRNPRKRSKAQAELRKFFQVLGGKPTIDYLQEVFRLEALTRFTRRGEDGFLESDEKVFEILTGDRTFGNRNRATVAQRQQASKVYGEKVFEEAVYGENEEYGERGALYRAVALVFKAPLFLAQARKGPSGTAGVMKLAAVFGIVDMDTADPAKYFLDAEPFTEEGEDTARLAQSIYCARESGQEVELTLTPSAAQHFADLLKTYREYPLEADLKGTRSDGAPEVLARLSEEAADVRKALLQALNDVFGKKDPRRAAQTGCYA